MKKILIKVNSLFILTLTINLIAPINNIGFAFAIKWLIDAGLSHDFVQLKNNLIRSGVIIMSFIIFNYLAKLLTSYYAEKRVKEIRISLLESILKQDFANFQNKTVSDYQHQLIMETKTISQDYFQGFFKIIRALALIGYSLLGMFIGNFWLALIILIATIIPIILSNFTMQKTRQYQDNLIKQEKFYWQQLKEIILGYLLIKNYQVESHFLN
ncbi:ABC transporter transmembrane domain-containing protein, partial [Bombilactobacillus bombi]|uniref:ABC transporter transmembrane domain-containing protein n=1 Tax=Bombilactobacillus bombi TaxID=1303590 RepID=UPI002159D01C